MPAWDEYPDHYRQGEIGAILKAVQAGECVSLVGLSGSGKSNLLGFLARRVRRAGLPEFLWADCNRLAEFTPAGLFGLLLDAVRGPQAAPDPGASPGQERRRFERWLADRQTGGAAGVCLLLDRFDAFPAEAMQALAGSLRAVRDAFKYWLTLVVATRRPLDASSELAELFYAHTIWLGPLSQADAHWSAAGYAARRGQTWPERILDELVRLSWGYPSLLRAACEAVAAGEGLLNGEDVDWDRLPQHPAVRRRVDEFWRDAPSPEDLQRSGLAGHPWLGSVPAVQASEAQPSPGALAAGLVDTSTLTAAEYHLLGYFQAHPGVVCSKDELIAAVWPEEVHVEGLRDDSLAQLVRRLRRKIEADPSNPRHILNVPGRGYRYLPPFHRT